MNRSTLEIRCCLIVLLCALVVFGTVPDTQARRLKKSFDTDSATTYDTPVTRSISFVTPPAPQGSSTVELDLAIRNICGPQARSGGYIPYLTLTRLNAPDAAPDLTDVFSGDSLPCVAQQPWVFTDGAAVGFRELDIGGYCAIEFPSPTVGDFVVCGNGVLDGVEECDDGNNTSFDGCSFRCLDESIVGTARLEVQIEPLTPYRLSFLFRGNAVFFDDEFQEGLNGDGCLAIEICLSEDEICGNGEDDDCDDQVDEAGCIPDQDGDGTPDDADCEPLNGSIHPGADELCDGVDNDCDEVVDNDPDGDGLAAGCDSCPDVFNAAGPSGQSDMDDDGLGDPCDPCPSDPLNRCFGPVARHDVNRFSLFEATEDLRWNLGQEGLYPPSFADCRPGETLPWGPDGGRPLIDFGFNTPGVVTGCNLPGTACDANTTGLFGCNDPTTAEIFLTGREDPASAPDLAFFFDPENDATGIGCAAAPRDYLVNLLFMNTQVATDAAGARVFDVALNGSVPAQLQNLDPWVAAGGSLPISRAGIASLFDLEPLDFEFRHEVGNPEIKALEVLQGPAAAGSWSVHPDRDGDGLGDGAAVGSCVEPPVPLWPGWVANGDDCDDSILLCSGDCTDADLDSVPACRGDCDDLDPSCSECLGTDLFADSMENTERSERIWIRQFQTRSPAAGRAWEVSDSNAVQGSQSWFVGRGLAPTITDASLTMPAVVAPDDGFLLFHLMAEPRGGFGGGCLGQMALEYTTGPGWIDARNRIVEGPWNDLPYNVWSRFKVSLAGLEGQSVRFRWRYTEEVTQRWFDDCFIPYETGYETQGFYVDDVRVVAQAKYYADADGDGLGDASDVAEGCFAPAGFVLTPGDECPSDPAKNGPGACGCGVPELTIFDFDFGGLGSNLGQFNNPRAIHIDDDGRLYVADRLNDRVQLFEADGTPVSAFPVTTPFGIGITRSNQVWVVDQSNDRIQLFDRVGRLQGEIGSFGATEGKFNDPLGLAISPTGQVYVVDRNNNRIQVFDEFGHFLRTFGWGVVSGLPQFEVCVVECGPGIAGGGPGQFSGAVGIAVDKSGRVYVGDSNNSRVQIFGADDSYLTEIGGPGTAEGQFDRPLGIAIDAGGRIWISDFDLHRVQVFDASGNFLFMFGSGVDTGAATFEICTAGCQAGSTGTGDGEFQGLLGLAASAQGDVYVTDFNNHRLQVFAPAPDGTATLSEVGNLQMSSNPVEVMWDPLAPETAARYDLISGSLSTLLSVGDFTAGFLFHLSSAALIHDVWPDPLPDEGYYYLIRAATPCAVGTFGDSSLVPDPRDVLDSIPPP